MSIEFNEQSGLGQGGNFRRIQNENTSQKGMIGWLVKKGIAKDENIGKFILLGVAIFFFAMSILSFYVL